MQRYKVKRHAGKRKRPMVAVTLAKEELAHLDKVCKRSGFTRSGLIGQLIRSTLAADGIEPELVGRMLKAAKGPPRRPLIPL